MQTWIDSEDGTRGGSIYLKRCHQSALEKGKLSKYIKTDSVGKKIKVVLSSWWYGCEIRGTVPREIPTLVWCRKKRGYIQSPPEEWSVASRVAMRLFLKTSGSTAACVSQTTRDSAKAQGFGLLDIEYAKITGEVDLGNFTLKRKNEKKVVFIVMDNGLVDKGYLRHLSIIDAVSSGHEVMVEIFGAGGSMSQGIGAQVRNNGYCKRPFERAKERNDGDYIFYLGCSSFEGLHMAVVEAAIVGIPSILSDIPAHRELESIADERLLIGNCASENIGMLRNLIDEVNYGKEMEKCAKLAQRFNDAGNVHGMGR